MRNPHADLSLNDLTKIYGTLPAVDRISFHIEAGEVLALLGPSGCGKTTCLRMVAGLVEPTSGQIHIGGNNVTKVPVHKRNIGMLFQSYALFPHLTVAQNVAFGLEMRGIKRAEATRRINEALQMVQLEGFGSRMPAQLSGGQQQRVALARALVIEPSLLLLDEPLGALDKNLRDSMQVELRLLQRRLSITTILVTHDQEEALTLADRILVMRNGRVEQIGTPAEVYNRPATRFVAGFVGVSNFFTARVQRREGGLLLLGVAGGELLVPGNTNSDQVTVAVRPEAVRVSHPTLNGCAMPNSVSAAVEQVIYRGSVTHFHLRLDNGDPLIAFQQNQEGSSLPVAFTPGSRVTASWGEVNNHIVREDVGQESREDAA
jgi:putative spermidine/putrescine transport system ATP-binding protein/spermidine/putrescine transport system ATP-binding protein